MISSLCRMRFRIATSADLISVDMEPHRQGGRLHVFGAWLYRIIKP